MVPNKFKKSTKSTQDDQDAISRAEQNCTFSLWVRFAIHHEVLACAAA